MKDILKDGIDYEEYDVNVVILDNEHENKINKSCCKTKSGGCCKGNESCCSSRQSCCSTRNNSNKSSIIQLKK